MFLNRYRNLRRLQEVRKVEIDFVLVRLAGTERVCAAVLVLSNDFNPGVDEGIDSQTQPWELSKAVTASCLNPRSNASEGAKAICHQPHARFPCCH
jgi:hypothetical protein